MRELALIGIGAGDPDWLTVEAIKAIQELDVLFVVTKESDYDDLVRIRRSVVERHRTRPVVIIPLKDFPRPWKTTPDYPAAVAKWRAQRLESWTAAVAENLLDGQKGGFMCWGDPSLYESTLAIVDLLIETNEGSPITKRVIPGISAVHALTARHGIPLNRQGKAIQIMPARLLRDGLPEDIFDAMVMLDGKQTFASIDPDGIDIYWGAYLGTPDQILISGDLAQTRDEILSVRAAALERKGWMFDTYLLRRRI